MNFDLSEEHLALKRMVRDFAEQEVAPVAEALDEKEQFPYDLVRKMGQMGLMGLIFPKEYGGKGADMLSYAIAIEELARVDSSIAITMAANVSLGGGAIHLFGTKEQKLRWLVPLARGEILGSMGLTEPGAGSDAGATQTRATLEGDEWVVNGTKEFITNSGTAISGFVTISAVTAEANGNREISNIVITKGTPGYSQAEPYNKMGWHTSDTHELSFVDCRVPKENLLGERGRGFKQLLQVLDGGRVSVAAIGVGLAQGCFEMSLEFAKKRTWAGQPLSRSQAVQFKLADMATNVELARLMTYKAAVLQDQGKPFVKEASMAKLFASEIAVKAADNAVDLQGIESQLSSVNRFFRDAKILTIGEGTSEVQRSVLARLLGC